VIIETPLQKSFAEALLSGTFSALHFAIVFFADFFPDRKMIFNSMGVDSSLPWNKDKEMGIRRYE
jgi:hypothetical protein